jgi:hypothetical protein
MPHLARAQRWGAFREALGFSLPEQLGDVVADAAFTASLGLRTAEEHVKQTLEILMFSGGGGGGGGGGVCVCASGVCDMCDVCAVCALRDQRVC